MVNSQNLSQYTDDIRHEYATGKATEHSYRDSLKTLLEAVDKGLTVINEPRRIEVGAPDYLIERGDIQLGFVEAKDVITRLDRLDKRSKKQIEDYRESLPNLLVTNYLDFQWYVGGELREDVSIGALRGGKLEFKPEKFDQTVDLLQRFTHIVTPTINSPRDLAAKMARLARGIADLIEKSLPDSDSLKSQLAAFEQTLIPNLHTRDFADMVAQTLAYGLFAARVEFKGARETFTLENAFWKVPQSNPFLSEFFQHVSRRMDDRVRWLVETLTQTLAYVNVDAVLLDFGKRTKQTDPVVHFYETFLREYSPSTREERGVYYTPEPVVSYIVRGVDHILQTRFDRAWGLADKDTLILDPATGTGTFLYFTINAIHERLTELGLQGTWSRYVREHLLPRLFGFELLVAPYAVAHMKLSILLKSLGYSVTEKPRLGVYLTNTLEESIPGGQIAFANFISEEANAATEIKKKSPIMVVMGNPPYSGHSANEGKWIIDRVRDYYMVDGKPLGERNSKWLQDDYVKFMRFGQWRIDETKSGVLAFVTNNGYLDNPTFRGMRQQLMNAFTDIYILNLHGSSKKRETAPDGGIDQNVFDIQQGVAIGIFIKEVGKPTPATIHYADLWGKRDDKYAALLATDLTNTVWTDVKPQSPYYLFTPQNIERRAEYDAFWKMTDVMQVNVLGFQTHRDHFAIDFDRAVLRQRIADMRDTTVSDTDFASKYAVTNNASWKISRARAAVQALPEPNGDERGWEKPLIQCAYRPFDNRWAYFSDIAMDRPRRELKLNVAHRENTFCLLISRQQATVGFRHVWVSDSPANDCVVSTVSREANQVFPLYLYPDPNKPQLLNVSDWQAGKEGRVPNLNPKFIAELAARLGMMFAPEATGAANTFTPEAVFHYAYAVFHAPAYRQRYAEFLKIDFPRLPLPANSAYFQSMAAFGARLVDLHLLRGAAFTGRASVKFPVDGDGTVSDSYPKYLEPTADKAGRIYINKTQYFEGVPANVWKFHVGGYQVAEKWLKDRRGRVLSTDDVTHYQRIITALGATITLMREIDQVYTLESATP